MDYLLPFWNHRISAGLTLLTGVLLLWQYPAAKGTAGYIIRWALALFLSVFVVYMNTPQPSLTSRLRTLRIPGISGFWHFIKT